MPKSRWEECKAEGQAGTGVQESIMASRDNSNRIAAIKLLKEIVSRSPDECMLHAIIPKEPVAVCDTGCGQCRL